MPQTHPLFISNYVIDYTQHHLRTQEKLAVPKAGDIYLQDIQMRPTTRGSAFRGGWHQQPYIPF